MRRRVLYLSLILAVLLLTAGRLVPSVGAQNLSFSVDRHEVDVWINKDGSVRLEYRITFSADPSSSPIDIVDLGLPSGDYSTSDIEADVNGKKTVSVGSDFQGEGSYGVALHLGLGTIRPGQTGTLHVIVHRVGGMVYTDTEDNDYASTKFIPVYFGGGFAHGSTHMTVRFHLPPGVQPEEPRWHDIPSGFSSPPVTYNDEAGLVVYEWDNPAASPSQAYTFGASFPRKYVEESVIQQSPSFLSTLVSKVVSFLCNPVVLVIGFIVLIVVITSRANARRRMKYLPPSMQVEGVGIKRGLTAVEAAIVLETPLNKVLTMMLFGLMKKGALTVLEDDPLKIQATEPRPEGLQPYEGPFLDAVKADGTMDEAKMRTVVVDLVKEVNNKMKGFSRKETVAYYRDIVKRAWDQVDAAETPEVKGKLFGEGLEWTMLDDQFKDHTEQTFGQGPVFLPMWWGAYRPWAHAMPAGGSTPSAAPGGPLVPSGPVQMPTLPGADFAGKIVRGIEGTAGRIVRSISDFTGGVTKVTNPPPKTSSSGGGSRGGWGSSGGHSCACACACACAGCACACAGGGR
jgi:hypothetical protein